MFVTHPASVAITPSAVDISGLADSSTQNVSSGKKPVNDNNICTQRVLGNPEMQDRQESMFQPLIMANADGRLSLMEAL